MDRERNHMGAVIFLVLAAFAFYRYPITRKNYEELRERNDRS